MKLWLISQTENNEYDTYDSAVVAAQTAKQAKQIHPGSRYPQHEDPWLDPFTPWARTPEAVKARCIGEAAAGVADGEIICASFNAG